MLHVQKLLGAALISLAITACGGGGGGGGGGLAAGNCCNETGGGCADGPNVTEATCDGTFHAGGTCRDLPDGGAVCGVLQE